MKKQKSEHDLLSVRRRDFFRKVLIKTLDQAESATQSMASKTVSFFAPAQESTPNRANIAQTPQNKPKTRPDNWLRPPGALPEKKFTETCSGCSECVKVCPANCIQIDFDSDNPIADGKPYIEPRRLPCVMCEDLSCMQSCPSGALQLVNLPTDIKMGIAVINHKICFRPPPPEVAPVDKDVTGLSSPEVAPANKDGTGLSSPEVAPVDKNVTGLSSPGVVPVDKNVTGLSSPGVVPVDKDGTCLSSPEVASVEPMEHGESDEMEDYWGIKEDTFSSCQSDCQACVSQCPVGSEALSIDSQGLIQVHAQGCTGCGVCEWVCPTTPAAIQIVSISAEYSPQIQG